MRFCPKCKRDYVKGIESCNDCGNELQEYIEVVDDRAVEDEYDYEKFLISVNDGVNADMLEALLNSKGIPVLKKFTGSGAFLKIFMGSTSQGVDFYVPSKLFSKAKEIIEKERKVNDATNVEEAIEQSEIDSSDGLLFEGKRYQRNRIIGAWIILLLFIPGLLYIVMLLIRLFIMDD